MKIIYVITKASEIGGAQIHVRDLSILSKNQGHDILVITGEKGALVDQLETSGVKTKVVPSLVRGINPLCDILCVIQLCKEYYMFKPDIIGLHSSKAGILGRLAAKITGFPAIFTAHGWSFAEGISPKKRKIYILIERIFSKLAIKIITVSKQDKDLAIKNRVSTDEHQVVIYNGVGPSLPTQKTNEESKTVKLIMVARFNKQKDHSTLINSLERLAHLDWRLDLVGGGPLLNKIRKLVDESSVKNKINILGERNDVDELLSSSHIFLLISNWEGYPLSILEAMSSGLPVICSNVGGVNEAVKDGFNGFLIERQDSVMLSEKIEKLICNSELRKAIGKNNYNDYIQKHSLETMHSKTLEVYKTVLEPR
ncbi:glycosyltransferase family 4 protein [Vibrio ouci]|uniref:Glycosyltransferase family 1 protein n=1 Tax=Vibrio ouci TaxID=2499078 RepID=A0A4Y8WL33_9VIBR|nr:glycosyltransferase family 4 protein [Vibrio ouci]TFH93001.1 glycosyltransferase family 1 protein [Vibrio ouci]